MTNEQIKRMIARLNSRWCWVGRRAAADLVETNLDQLEGLSSIDLLVSAVRFPAIRARALGSLGRRLSVLNDEQFKDLSGNTRVAIRRSIGFAAPLRDADFLVSVSKFLLRHSDVDAIPYLELLVECSTIKRQYEYRAYGRGVLAKEYVSSFDGSRDDQLEMNRVRAAAHVALERLRLLARKNQTCTDLLRPALAPDADRLMRPASNKESKSAHLVRLPTDHADT